MDRGVQQPQERQDSNSTLFLTVPPRTLLVLCGPAGSGKSTFAEKLIETHQHLGFKPTMIVSSDICRAIVCDDENNQQANRDAFDLFHFTLHKRMFYSRFTIADSTALQAHARLRLLEVAQRHNYFTSLLIFNISPATCTQRDKGRTRMVGESVIAYHTGLLQKTITEAPTEGWHQIHVLDEEYMEVEIRIVPIVSPVGRQEQI
jgi:predicted kinase